MLHNKITSIDLKKKKKNLENTHSDMCLGSCKLFTPKCFW